MLQNPPLGGWINCPLHSAISIATLAVIEYNAIVIVRVPVGGSQRTK